MTTTHTTADILNILQAAELTEATKTSYKDRIQYMEKLFGTSIMAIILSPKASIKRLKNAYEKDASRKTYLAVVLALFRHVPKLKENNYKVFEQWMDAFSQTDKAIEERYKQNAPTKKQEDGYVEFDDIIAMRDKLQKGTDDRLILAMYTHIPPLRADFNNVRIYKTIPAKPIANYIHLRKQSCKLFLGEFKTFAKHGVYEKELPAALCSEIHASLDERPRDYLFTNKADEPYVKANSYTQFVNATLKRLFKRPLTISLIRHSFISTLDFNTLTIAEKEAIAGDMLHTTRLQDQYRLIFKKPAGKMDA
jgi:hypothetical protein